MKVHELRTRLEKFSPDALVAIHSVSFCSSNCYDITQVYLSGSSLALIQIETDIPVSQELLDKVS